MEGVELRGESGLVIPGRDGEGVERRVVCVAVGSQVMMRTMKILFHLSEYI